MAKDALYDMIAINPESDSIIFNLAYFYYENRQYASATLVSQELLARNAKNQDYLKSGRKETICRGAQGI